MREHLSRLQAAAEAIAKALGVKTSGPS
jgi:hypothetical protein